MHRKQQLLQTDTNQQLPDLFQGSHISQSAAYLVPDRDDKGYLRLEERRWMAKEAFAVSSHYDSAIFNYFDAGEGSAFRCSVNSQKQLRYGENPHQKGYFYGNLEAMFDQIHGKEISYNNLLDINAAVDLIDEFEDLTFAILKHNNACGLASRPTVLEAWKDALAGDPVSQYNSV